MRFANPVGLALLGLTIPVILLHVLRPRRTPFTVSSTFLWRRVETPVSAATPWQRLRWSLLLVAQLLAVILAALAVARPLRVQESAFAEHTIFVVDASGSMAATDGAPDRLASAKQRALELRDDLPSGGTASIVVAGDRPRVVLTASPDEGAFEQSLRTVAASAGHPDFGATFDLAESLDTEDGSVGYVFLSDGGLSDDEEDLLPLGTRVERVGSVDTNRALTHFTVEPRGSGLHARLTVSNTGGPAVTQTVRVDVDGALAAEHEVTLAPGAREELELDIPDGERIEAFLEGGDLLSADDHAVAAATPRPELTILLAGDTLFWEELLTSIPNVVTDVSETAISADGYDLAIYSGVDPPAAPGAPFFAIAPPGGVPGVTLDGAVEFPSVTLVQSEDALLEGLDLAGVDIATAQRIVPGDAEVLVAGERAPLLVRGTAGEVPFLYMAFALRDSDLAVQVAFPLLGDRIVTELAGVGQPADPLVVGDPLPVDTAAAAHVLGPDGRVREVEAGHPAPRATRPGFWVITAEGKRDVIVAVNAPEEESAIRPVDVAAAPAPPGDRQVSAADTETSLLAWVLWPLLVLLVAETFLNWRRLGVGRGQWLVALSARLVVMALLAAALVGPVIRRREDRVATVFILDASASMGSPGRAAGEQWVRDALAARAEDDLAAVVFFGADARVGRVLDASSTFAGASVAIDASATDAAVALRLGAALLPADARRRVVLVSDGRVNTGATEDEIAALEELGIPVDVHTVTIPAGLDATVEGIDVPRLARVDEEMSLVVHVHASEPATATVTLRRDGADVSSREVSLVAGDNAVEFRDVAGVDAGTILRYEAVVTAAGDEIAENDSGHAAVPVEGPARVLVVEGTEDEATTLVSALAAGGLQSDVVSATMLPNVERLAGYSSVILVNVDAPSLTGPQVKDLTTAVRDLGVGLVTIGGARSYGVGGYRQSPLSDLLPVDSEVVDPKRLKTVAEVLSIDTSESMSACHCREGQIGPDGMPAPGNGGMFTEGGVNKTDISKAAAERTISALGATDEVGVLAWNSTSRWIIELQQLPSADVIESGLRSLTPQGQTNLSISLDEAADALLESSAELKHIILFTDGFTDPRVIDSIADEAGRLYSDHGISVSVLGTGEGACPLLEDIAVQGHGRYYPGTDLDAVPQIMAEEAVVASRDFITEGTFLPEVTSDDPVVAPLVSSPPLLGYVATTAKAQASTLLRIGPDRDPLLATWQAGLGRSTSWTSDVTNWSADWESWDGFIDFWGRVVKDTFRGGDTSGGATATIRNSTLTIDVETAAPIADGAVAVANVAGPDGQMTQVTLERGSDTSFTGAVPATRSGTYAVGVTVNANDGELLLTANTLANESYPPEYAPGEADTRLMARISSLTNGRGEIESGAAFDRDGLAPGWRRHDLTAALLLSAAVLWPFAILLSRVPFRRRRREAEPGDDLLQGQLSPRRRAADRSTAATRADASAR